MAPEPVLATEDPVVAPEPVVRPSRSGGVAHARSGAAGGRELIEGWEQGSKGNSVTVAAIKAARRPSGGAQQLEAPDRGVPDAEPTQDGGCIVMRDGFELTLTQKEFEQAAAAHGFVPMWPKDLLGNANQLYVAAANVRRWKATTDTASRCRTTAHFGRWKMASTPRMSWSRWAASDCRSTPEGPAQRDEELRLDVEQRRRPRLLCVERGPRLLRKGGATRWGLFGAARCFGRTIRTKGHSNQGTALFNEKVKKAE